MIDCPSITALGVAKLRALHQLRDSPPILNDFLALAIVGIKNSVWPYSEGPEDMIGREVRAFIVARSRYVEDRLTLAMRQGVNQYIILGAGLDTSACRLAPIYPSLVAFEVDHPLTQRWKQRMLLSVGVYPYFNIKFVPVNFETQNLGSELTRAGFVMENSTFVSWLGVTPYLSGDAFDNSVSFLSSLSPGSEVVFDYAVHPKVLTKEEQAGLAMVARRGSAVGEPFRLALDPCQLTRDLQAGGFKRIQDIGKDELNLLYFCGRSDDLSLRYNAARMCHAYL